MIGLVDVQSGGTPRTKGCPLMANDHQSESEAYEQAHQDAAEIENKYEPGARPTVVLPGTDGMVSGTAFADMVDENGELKEDSSPDD